MRYTFLEILNTIVQPWGDIFTKLPVNDQAALKVGENYILEDICVNGKIPLLKKHGFINAVTKYNTGTVTIATADGVSTVTGSSTAWTADMIGRAFILSGDDIAYTIKTVASATSLTLEEIYINQSADTNTLSTATAYTINKYVYKLAKDFASFAEREIYDVTGSIDLEIRDSVEFDDEIPNRTQTGNPLYVVLRGLSEAAYYNTGTIAVTNGSASITGSSTAWTAQMNGMPIRKRGDSAEYTFTYVSATSGTLDRVYEGTTATGASYDIEFPGLMQAQLDPKPSTPRLIKYFYYRMLPKFVNDNDVCQLPIQNALISGGRWQFSLIREKGNLPQIETFYKIYQRDLALLRMAGHTNPYEKGMKRRYE